MMRLFLRRLLAVGVLIASCQCASIAQDKQVEGMGLLKHAMELTDLRQSGPYHMHNILSLTDEVLGKQLTGEEVIYFISPQQWRRELRIKDYYDESAYFIGTNMYRGRSLTFTPPAGRKDIAARLRTLPVVLEYKVLRIYDREVAGTP